MTISARSYGVPVEVYVGDGMEIFAYPGSPTDIEPTDISVLAIQAYPTDVLIYPPDGWTAVGGGIINTHPNKAGPDSFAVMFIREGDITDTVTEVRAEWAGGFGWVKAKIVTYQKDTEPGWSYSVAVEDYTYGDNSVTGSDLFLTLESNVSEVPVQSTFTDDFVTLNTDDWLLYDGVGRGGAGLRLPVNVSVVAGVLTLVGTPAGLTGGVKLKGHSQQYGQWDFRARVRPGAAYYRPIIRLWAVDGGDGDTNANGSINLVEVVRSSDRAKTTFSLDYYAGGFQRASSEVVLDLTQWHVYSVVWEIGGVFFYVDGSLVWASYNTAIQPVGAADVCIMLEYYSGEVAIPGTKKRETPNYLAASFEVDYIQQYSLPVK